MASQLLLVRHGPIEDRYARRYIGHLDVPLHPDWGGRCGPLAAFLRGRKPAKCYCSPLLRARQTADLVVPSCLSPQVDEDLREIDFGDWDGHTWEEISAANQEIVKGWWTMADDFAFPSGDTIAAFVQRVRRVARRMVEDPAEVVLAITHGGVIRMMIGHLLGLPPRSYLMFAPARGTCAVLDVFPPKSPQAWNDGGMAVLAGLNLPEGTA